MRTLSSRSESAFEERGQYFGDECKHGTMTMQHDRVPAFVALAILECPILTLPVGRDASEAREDVVHTFSDQL